MRFLTYLVLMLLSSTTYAGTVLYVNSTDPKSFSAKSASGFVIANTGRSSIGITNYHVCVYNYSGVVLENHKPIYGQIVVKYEKKAKYARILLLDRYTDLCALEIRDKLSRFKISKLPELKKGDRLRVLGSPKMGTFNVTYVDVDRESDEWRKHHRGSLVASGNSPQGTSGSAVVDYDGKVVGVNWGYDKNHNNTYFISLYRLKNFLKKLEKTLELRYN